jgi:hypothetical protein
MVHNWPEPIIGPMSETRKFACPHGMSVLPSGADIVRRHAQVGFVPRGDKLPPGRISHQHQHETFISTNSHGRGSLHRSLSVPDNPLRFAF